MNVLLIMETVNKSVTTLLDHIAVAVKVDTNCYVTSRVVKVRILNMCEFECAMFLVTSTHCCNKNTAFSQVLLIVGTI